MLAPVTGSRRLGLLVLAGLWLALASCVDQGDGRDSPQPSVPVAVAALPPEWRDYGDAPEGTATLYREGAQEGQFPARAASGAPAHELSSKVWLGLLVSPEAAPRGRDGDDGLLHLEVYRCARSSALVLVNVSGLSRADRGSPVFLNLFFDWNRDGRWQGGDACAQEWAVQNYPVDVSRFDERNGLTLVDVPFTAGEQADEFWYRAMVTRRQVGPQFGLLPDGETEDYLHQAALTFSARPDRVGARSAPVPDEPTFTCQGGIIGHGDSDTVFRITQTAESRGRVVGRDVRIEARAEPFVLREARAETARLSQDRLEITLRATLRSPEDEPQRIVGPRLVVVSMAGSYGGARQGRFDATIDCAYYVEHGPGNFPFGEFVGAPVTGVDPTDGPPPGMHIVPHGRRARLAAGGAGQYSGFMRAYGGSRGSEAGIVNAFSPEDGLVITTARRGRGIEIEPRRDDPERVDWYVVFVNGTDGEGADITDVYRFFVLHGPRELLERAAPLFTEAAPPALPERTPTATPTATPTSTRTPTPTPTATPARAVAPSATPTTVASPIAPREDCLFGILLALAQIDVHPGEFHEGLISIAAWRDPARLSGPLAGVRMRLEARRSDGQVTQGVVTTNERGEATARMQTTAFGQNTLIVTQAEREGCTWTQAQDPPRITWEARP